MLYRWSNSLPKIILLLFIFPAGAWANSPILLNELMAINDKAWADPQGEYDDWVELYNPTDQPVRADGLYLTDNIRRLTKWKIGGDSPTEIIIPPQEFLVLWIDQDTEAGSLHANFKLSGNGEELALVDRDGITLLDFIEFPAQFSDVSYGRFPDAVGEWQFMETATPDAVNTEGYQGIAEEVLFSEPHGFYDETITVALSTTTPDAEIWYTTEHQSCQLEPFRDKLVRAATRYTEPIVVSKTTCIRALAVREGWKDSAIKGQTYLFLDDVIRQSSQPTGFPTDWGNNSDFAMDPKVVDDPLYRDTIKDDLKTIPSLCLTLSNEDMFGIKKGIFAYPQARGVAWERLATIEWLDPNTGNDFTVNAGLRVHGGAGRNPNIAKHGLRILFKSEYGPSLFNYPLFPDMDITTFDSLVLRACWNYSWIGHSGMGGPRHAQYMRDAFCRDTARDMGQLVPHGRHVHVYINGLYWGLYILMERPDEDFAAIHMGGDKEDYEVLKADRTSALQMEIMSGDIQTWHEMFAYAQEDLSLDEHYEVMQTYVDVPALIDYMLLVFYTGSRDAPTLLFDSSRPNNFYTIRSITPPRGFTFQVWDMEWCLEQPTINRVPYLGGRDNPTALFGALGAHPDFRRLVADHIHRHFFNDGPLTAKAAADRYWERIMDIDRAIVGESARWGDSLYGYAYTRDREWVAERDRLMADYFPIRTDIVIDQLKRDGWYPLTEAPIFHIDNQYQHGGDIVNGAQLSIVNPDNTGSIYYSLDGTDPRFDTESGIVERVAIFVSENAEKRVWVPTEDIGFSWLSDPDFDDSRWYTSSYGIGFDLNWIPNYDNWIDLDLEDSMWGKNASCYWRTEFNAEHLERVIDLKLRIRYDDAFVAFLNGVKVAEAGAPAELTWDASAKEAHEASAEFVDYEITQALALLKESGPNLLAIQGLNAAKNNIDFLLSVELVAEMSSNESSDRYSQPIPLEASTTVKAAVLQGNTWSALNEAHFQVVGPFAATEHHSP